MADADMATSRREDHDVLTRRLSRALGGFSLGLGLVQLIAPRAVNRLSGVDDSAAAHLVVPMVGVRELGHAAALLVSRKPEPWVWTRVAGDAMDLTALGRALLQRRGTRRMRVAVATAAVVGITAVDVYTAIRARAHMASGSLRTKHFEAAATVKCPPEEVYQFWHEFENLPRFMYHLESVQTTGDSRSHWAAKAPAGMRVEWDAEMIQDRPNRLISWRSVDGAPVSHAGSVRFVSAPGGRGTEVRVEMEYSPPGGKVGTALAKIFGEEPEQQVKDDLRRLKQVMETGEVVRSEGSPEGTTSRRQLTQRPARPLTAAR
jgi:uncharacterized membrane protein